MVGQLSPRHVSVMRKAAAVLFLAMAGLALLARQDVATPLPLVPPWLLPAVLWPRAMPVSQEPVLPPALPAPPAPERQISLLLVGDTGLNASFQPVQAGFAFRNGVKAKFDDATSDIAALIGADVSLANLETVVTDRNDLAAVPKMFGFRTHPDGVRELMRIGFDVFSTANNHALDYGPQGAGETLRHLERLGAAQAGLGRTRDSAVTPAVIERHGVKVAFGAIGIGAGGFGTPREGDGRAGQLAFTDDNLSDVVEGLAVTPADIRVVSVHHGEEFDVMTSVAEHRRLRGALDAGADLVVGHHQHVVAGIAFVDGKAIFHGLGNFLHWGTQDMGRHDMCRDYGLVARVHLSARDGERMQVRAIEAMPVTNMHARPRRLAADASRERIHVLNHLGRQLPSSGVQFAIEADGMGLFCAPGADRLAGDIGQRCSRAPAPEVPEPALASRIAAACARRVVRIVQPVADTAPSTAPGGQP